MKIASFHSDIDSPKNLSYASIGRLDQLSSIKVRGLSVSVAVFLSAAPSSSWVREGVKSAAGSY